MLTPPPSWMANKLISLIRNLTGRVKWENPLNISVDISLRVIPQNASYTKLPRRIPGTAKTITKQWRIKKINRSKVNLHDKRNVFQDMARFCEKFQYTLWVRESYWNHSSNSRILAKTATDSDRNNRLVSGVCMKITYRHTGSFAMKSVTKLTPSFSRITISIVPQKLFVCSHHMSNPTLFWSRKKFEAIV